MFKVMLVEDEEKSRKLLAILIAEQNLGFEVVAEASNGLMALELLHQQEIDLIISDIRMPLMDGISLAEHVMEQDLDCSIIFVTAYDDFEYAQKAVRLGIKDFIVKPLNRQDLRETLEKRRRELLDKNNHDGDMEEGLVERVLDYVKNNIGDPNLSLSDTANVFFVNASYLSRVFKKKCDINFVEYLTRYRIKKAILYMENTDMKAYEIAEKVGFTDTKYFGKCFKKITGMSIQEYRKK